MKRIKARYDSVFLFFFPFFILSSLVYGFAFFELPLFASCHLILSLFAFLFIFHPKAALVLGDPLKKGRGEWCLKLFFSQFLVSLWIAAFSQVICLDPITFRPFAHINPLHFSVKFGLFPWGFTVLTALTLAFFTYRKKSLGLVSSALEPLFKNSHLDAIGVTVDSYMRYLTIYTLIFLLVWQMLSISVLLHYWLGLPLARGLTIKLFFINSVLLILVTHRYWVSMLHQLYYRISPFYILLGVASLLGMLYPLLSGLGNKLVAAYPAWQVNDQFLQDNALVHITILVTLSWMSGGIINGAYIAMISKGRTLREVIIYTLITNCLGLLLLWLFGKITSVPALSKLGLTVVLLLLMTSFLIWLLLQKKNATYFLRATIPSQTPIKLRSHFRLIKILPLAIVTFFGAYFATGLSVWSFFAVAGGLPPVMILLMSYVGWIKVITRSSTCG